MGHIVKTPAGSYRANWRDPSGRQRAKTFPTKREASAFLAEVESTLNRGSYIDPASGKIRFAVYAEKWIASRNTEKTTTARDRSVMRVHVVPRWGSIPLGKIEHSAIQEWVTELGQRLSPASVSECHRLVSAVLRLAVADRVIGSNPAEGVRLPKRRRKDVDFRTISHEELARLLPCLPEPYRALVALAAGAGLRWGEAVGLRWDAVDLDGGSLRVVRVAVEVAGTVTAKPYPKSKAGRREVPLPAFVVELLREHRKLYPAGPLGEVFTNSAGGPVRRTLFRTRVWRPALVRAGLLGRLVESGPDKHMAHWLDATGLEWTKEFTTEREAVAHIVQHGHGGPTFHDLRHSYATWLVSSGVPINDVSRVLGHEQTSTTLDRYTHPSASKESRVRAAFADFLLTPRQE